MSPRRTPTQNDDINDSYDRTRKTVKHLPLLSVEEKKKKKKYCCTGIVVYVGGGKPKYKHGVNTCLLHGRSFTHRWLGKLEVGGGRLATRYNLWSKHTRMNQNSFPRRGKAVEIIPLCYWIECIYKCIARERTESSRSQTSTWTATTCTTFAWQHLVVSRYSLLPAVHHSEKNCTPMAVDSVVGRDLQMTDCLPLHHFWQNVFECCINEMRLSTVHHFVVWHETWTFLIDDWKSLRYHVSKMHHLCAGRNILLLTSVQPHVGMTSQHSPRGPLTTKTWEWPPRSRP